MRSQINRRPWVNRSFPLSLPSARHRRQMLRNGLLLASLGLPCSIFSGCGTLSSKSSLKKQHVAPTTQVASVVSAADARRERNAGPSNGDVEQTSKPATAKAAPSLSSPTSGPVAPVSYERPVVAAAAAASGSIQSSADQMGYGIPLQQPLVSYNTASYSTANYGTADYNTANCAAPSANCSSCGTQCSVGETPCFPGTEPLPKNPNEYIFDGGDQQPAVLVKQDWTTAGVDPTDTVIYYETLGGQVCVKPSNRVPIYAPRFAAVRQVTGVNLAARAVGTERMLLPVAPVGIDESNLVGNVSVPLAPQGEQQVGMLDAFQENRLGVPIAQVLPPMRLSETLVMFENITFFTTGEMVDDEIPVLGLVLANAREWYTPESVEVLIDGQAAALVVDTKRAQDVHVYEMPDKCAMRICKAASHTIANSGDIVRFTIRFDNVGPKPLGNAVVMDSLSARLEYIEGSQQCSVEAQFTAEANEVGSQVLRWEIEEAISPSEGGVISFDCRVR